MLPNALSTCTPNVLWEPGGLYSNVTLAKAVGRRVCLPQNSVRPYGALL